MDSLKTYQHVNRADANLSFGISRMEDIYDKRNGQADAPHRHNYYTILIISKGKGLHHIDFNSYPINANQIYFLSPGQVHQLVETEKTFGYSMVFSEQFLVLNHIPIAFIADINLFQDFGSTPPLPLDPATSSTIESYAEALLTQFRSDLPFKFEAIGALLKLLLIHCHNLCSLNNLDIQTQESGGDLLRKFKKMVHGHYHQWHRTTAYADALNITPDHLNRVVKSLTGKTAKDHIQSRITTAAKRLLYFSELSNKEIAYELGFSEPGNFSAFFKKCSGISPSQFKQQSKASPSQSLPEKEGV